MIRLVAGAHSDVGRVRGVNQDAAFVDEDLGACAVADGMGGHRGGEVASALAVETLAGRLRAADPLTADVVVDAVEDANDRVHRESEENDDVRGMGTTLCALVVVEAPEAGLVVVNVGDSRVYRLHEGELEQLTEDHSLVGDLVRSGRLSVEEAATHPMRNVVTRVIGVEPVVHVDRWERPAVHGERYLLCSDGLFNEVAEARIASTLRSLADPAEAARVLVGLANDGGGRDNITCVVADVVEDAAGPVTPVDPGPTAGAALAAELAGSPERGPVATSGAGPGAGPGGPIAAVGRSWRPRRLTGRVVAFLVALAVLAGAVGLVLRSWERSRYVVRPDGTYLAIFRGPDERTLWFGPERVETTTVALADLTAAQVDQLERFEATSLQAARRWVDDLRAATTTTTVTTVTTTIVVVTTTPPVTTAAPATAPVTAAPAAPPPASGG